jgi:hypothetical protein
VKFYRNETIEQRAEQRLLELERLLGAPVPIPVPIDLLAERVLGLSLLWEPIDEMPGEVVLGAIIPEKKVVVLNENRLPLFNEKPGLERSTKGHEMGHWDLFVDQSLLGHPALFPDQPISIAYRNTPSGDATVMKAFIQSEAGREYLRDMNDRADHPDEARAVNRYAAAISLPRVVLYQEVSKIDRTKWPNLYKLAKTLDVTISALTVRLEQLNLLYVGENKELYESADHAKGQGMLGF